MLSNNIQFAFRFRADKKPAFLQLPATAKRLALDSQPKENAIMAASARTDVS